MQSLAGLNVGQPISWRTASMKFWWAMLVVVGCMVPFPLMTAVMAGAFSPTRGARFISS